MENFEKAYNYAVYLLGLKLRTEGEMREKMRLKSAKSPQSGHLGGPASGGKYNAEIIDAVIKQLNENHYLDDQRYAEVYLDNLKKYKNFGFYGIKKKLMEKRLPAEIISSVLEAGLTPEEETKIAKRFLAKNKIDDKQKAAQRLKTRGFRGETVAKLLFCYGLHGQEKRIFWPN